MVGSQERALEAVKKQSDARLLLHEAARVGVPEIFPFSLGGHNTVPWTFELLGDLLFMP